MALLNRNKKPLPPDGQMELMDHLAELRERLFRSAGYVLLGMVVAYIVYPQIYFVLDYPVHDLLNTFGRMAYTSLLEPFLLRMQVSLIAGLVLAFPFITGELWGFIAPALTDQERKPLRFLAPFTILLFLAGVATAYASLPAAYGWMLSFMKDVPNAVLNQKPSMYILLTVKILLAFGASFELPLVLLFMARVGIINADMMRKYWRHATVIIAVVAAVVAPSNDPLTMVMMAVPMVALYLLSIGLVRAFEPKEDGTRSLGLAAMLWITLLPVAILIAVGVWLWRSHMAVKPTNALPAITQPVTAQPPAGKV